MLFIGIIYLFIFLGICYLILNSILNLRRREFETTNVVKKSFTEKINGLTRLFLGFFLQVVATLQLFFTLLSRLLMERTWIGIITLVAIFVIIWNGVPVYDGHLNLKYYTEIFTKLGILNPNDIQTLNFINTTSKTFLVIFGAAIPFFYFTYREQKATSASSIISKTNSLIMFVVFFLLSLPFAFFLNRILAQYGRTSSLLISSQEEARISIWVVFSVFAFIYFIRAIRDLLRSINLRLMLKDLVKKIDDMFFTVSFVRFKIARKEIYEDLHTHIESIYQLLAFCIEKNIDNVFDANYGKWMDVVRDLLETPRLRFIHETVLYEVLHTKDPEKFENLYRSILDKHISLIMTCYKNHKIERGHQCVSSFQNLNPRVDELRVIFMDALHELTVLLFNNEQGGLRTILQSLEELSVENKFVEKNAVIMIYKSLILRAIQKNDPIVLASISNSLLNSIGDPIGKETQNAIAKKLLRSHIKKWKLMEDEAGKSSVFMIMQAILKSIELSHHQCSGYLIKFLATNFEPNMTSEIFNVFVRNRAVDNPFLKQRKLYRAIDFSFPYNKNTLDYCVAKLIILIYGHQLYLSQKGIVIGFEQNSLIDIRTLGNKYNDYLFRSIKESKGAYRLWFLSDEKFMVDLKHRFMVAAVKNIL
ncbi:hypothetical protein EV586_10874 [Tumebacillus sp. BK434]|uniref:hypothetical protein n=1 Tax=Tumebacillus sp. BK434 TaxID=2512169 RepID=UPI00104E8CBF|nr:hypothetical protein [Tumebacillus sp. BK434]TCP52699.1 hypothetical protein EV586_10874 [Tumebacillus sp. BK434]